jgi:hypothetical protein
MNKSMWNSEAVKAYESGQGVVLVEKPYPHYEPVACLPPTPISENALYTTPPQRTWVGLTEDEILLISADCAATHQHTDIHFAKAIEAALKAKNT